MLRYSDGHPDADADGLGLLGNLASADERFRPLNVLGAHFRFGERLSRKPLVGIGDGW
jgi:hypothetical protein